VEDLIKRIHTRYDALPDTNRQADMWSATFTLMGLRYEATFIHTFLNEVSHMRESSFYQMILDEGRQEVLLASSRSVIYRVGMIVFGTRADEHVRDQIEAIDNVETLDQLADQIQLVKSWSELIPSLDAKPSAD